MAWRALTQDDILTGLTGIELNAIRTLVLGDGQADPLTPTIQTTVDQVRGYIAGSVNIVLGAEGTIPDKLINTAIDIAVFNLCKRLPAKVLMTEAREKSYDAAIRLLKDVANNKFRFEVPTDISPEPIAVPLPSISHKNTRNSVRLREDGI